MNIAVAYVMANSDLSQSRSYIYANSESEDWPISYPDGVTCSYIDWSNCSWSEEYASTYMYEPFAPYVNEITDEDVDELYDL